MKIPITLPSRELSYIKNIDKKINKELKKGIYIGGENVNNFEENMKNFLKTKYVVTLNSGTDALYLSLLALGIKKGDEVLVPSFTFFASIECIYLVGAKPIFVDIDINTYCFDIDDLKKKITKKTKAIIPVHLFGNSGDLKELIKVSKNYNLRIVEDAAQSFGSRLSNEKYLGTIGDLGAFSFYPSKTLGGIGDGGMIATNNKKYFNLLMKLKNHGQSRSYEHEVVGTNSRLDSINALVLNEKLKIFKEITSTRNSFYTFYLQNLSHLEWIKLPTKENKNTLLNYFTIFTKPSLRNKLANYLSENNISTSIYYKKPLHMQSAVKTQRKVHPSLKNTEEASKSVLSIPYYSFPKEKEMEYVVSKILKFIP